MILVVLLAAALEISVAPKVSSIDQPVSIAIRGTPNTAATVRLRTRRFGMTFESQATYQLPSSGSLDIADPMRLFWQVMPTNDPPQPFAFRRDSDLKPREYSLFASDGASSVQEQGTRTVLQPGVTRRVADSGDFVATFFEAGGKECHPGVIVLGGSDGGVPEEFAAVLAGHGLNTLALAYFDAPGLSRTLTNVPIEIVRSGANFLSARRSTCAGSTAVVGSSKGAELALVAASTFQQIGAVVAYAPASVVFSGIGAAGSTEPPSSSWSYLGTPLPFANGTVPDEVRDTIAAARSSHQKISYRDEYLAQMRGDPDAVIAAEKIRGPLLLIAGGNDRLWPSDIMAKAIIDRRRARKVPYLDELL